MESGKWRDGWKKCEVFTALYRKYAAESPILPSYKNPLVHMPEKYGDDNGLGSKKPIIPLGIVHKIGNHQDTEEKQFSPYCY